MSTRTDPNLTADEAAPHFDRRTALATIMLVREYIQNHPPTDWDTDASAQEIVADMVLELRPKIVTSEHWRGRLLTYLAREKR